MTTLIPCDRVPFQTERPQPGQTAQVDDDSLLSNLVVPEPEHLQLQQRVQVLHLANNRKVNSNYMYYINFTSTISLLNKAKTFSLVRLFRFSILLIRLKLRSNHSRLTYMEKYTEQ